MSLSFLVTTDPLPSPLSPRSPPSPSGDRLLPVTIVGLVAIPKEGYAIGHDRIRSLVTRAWVLYIHLSRPISLPPLCLEPTRDRRKKEDRADWIHTTSLFHASVLSTPKAKGAKLLPRRNHGGSQTKQGGQGWGAQLLLMFASGRQEAMLFVDKVGKGILDFS